MEKDFVTTLPSEVAVDILSRLPIRTAMRCKCVSKPWLGLLTTPEFVKSHLSKSSPVFAAFKNGTQSEQFKFVEFVDEADPDCDDHPWKPVSSLNLPCHETLHASADGLLILCTPLNTSFRRGGDLLLCNPITRECIRLPCPRKTDSEPVFPMESYGFGVSRTSGRYKVVRILPLLCRFNGVEFHFQVHTVGTGSWREIVSPKNLVCVPKKHTYLNGSLHLLAHLPHRYAISCLDLETETFTSFSTPPIPDSHQYRHLSVLRDCLCVCDNSGGHSRSGFGYEIDIWLMKEYGHVGSWSKQFVIRKFYKEMFLGFLCPIKVFKDGDILMEFDCKTVLYYSSKNETIREVDPRRLGSSTLSTTTMYTPSFLPLKSFGARYIYTYRAL